MLYWSEVYALAAALVFVGSGMMFLIVLTSLELREYAAARMRIRQRLTKYVSQPFRDSPREFANYFANPQRGSVHSPQNTVV
jgi:hypothetical protein